MDNKNRPMTDIEKNNIKFLFHEKVNIFNKNIYEKILLPTFSLRSKAGKTQ